MDAFKLLARELLMQGVALYATSGIDRTRNSLIYASAVGGLSALCIIFLAVGIFFHFAQIPLLASAGLYTSILLFVLALAAYIFMRIKLNIIEKQLIQEKVQLQNTLEVAMLELGQELREPIQEHPLASLLISGITGFALGKKYL